MAEELKDTCTEYIHIFGLAGTYYGEQRRRDIHQKIADILNVSFDDLKPILHYLEKEEIINFPLKDFNDYDQILKWDEKTVKKWGYILYDYLIDHFTK